MDVDDMIIVLVVDEEKENGEKHSTPDDESEVVSSEEKAFKDLLENLAQSGSVSDINVKTEFPDINIKDENAFEYYDYSSLEEQTSEEKVVINESIVTNIKVEKVEPLNIQEEIQSLQYELEVCDDANTSVENSEGLIRTIKIKSVNKINNQLNEEWKKITLNQLKMKNPNLKSNQNLLISTLVDMMTKVKPPLPPDNIYIKTNEGLRCKFCKTVTDRHNAATRHYQDYHGPRYLSCYGCGADFRSCNNLYRHERRCSSRDAVVILKARGIFLGRKGRGRPFLRKTPFLKEINMGEKSTKKDILVTEEQTQSGDKCIIYNCLECPSKFKTKYSLIAHKHMHKGIRPYQCESCSASYTAKSALNRHLLTHVGPQFTCDYCGRSLMTKAALRHHIDTHFKVKNFPCSECNKRYSQKSALLVHENKVHKELPPPFSCQVCPKSYYRLYLLKEHMMKEHGMVLMTKTMLLRSLSKLPTEEVGNILLSNSESS